MTNPFLAPCCAGYERHFFCEKSLPYCTQTGLKGVCDTSAPSRPPPLRGRGTPSLFLQTASPANHNHGSAAHLSASHSPYRLAVPEKIFALFVRSIFSTATDSPPRFIRHRRRSAPNPTPRDPFGYSEISPNGGASFILDYNLYGSPPGRSLYSCKRNQNTLGALPQDPCRWLCWIRI